MAKKAVLNVAIRNEIQPGGVLELYFLDEIYDYIDWSEWTIVNLLQDVINKVTAAKPSKIILYINSPGGDATLGLGIYNFLTYMTGVEREVRTLAMAGSIASVIAQAASQGKRYIASTGFMVIHKAWGWGIGNGDELREAADVMDLYTAQICEVYAQKSGRPAQEFQDLIANGDYWMTGADAVALGLADETFEDMPEGFSAAASIKDLDENYRNVPANLQELLTKPAPAPAPGAANIDSMTFKERLNNFTNSLKTKTINRAAPNLAEEVANVMSEPLETLFNGVQEDIDAQIAAAGVANKTITDGMATQITNLETANQTLTTQLGTLQTAHDTLKTAHDNLLNDVKDKTGSESGGGPAPKASTGFGSFVSNSVTAEGE